MRNLFDYINEYGAATFADEGFNNIDALILARLSYIPFEGVMAADGETSVSEAAHEFFRAEGSFDRLTMLKDATLLAELARSRRFRDLPLSHYVNHIDYGKQKQFSAVTIGIGESLFISCRGTDNTLVGWKEDFNMSFMERVPAQLDAVAYMQAVAGESQGTLMAGGHSKGGNLAVYASAFAGVGERITGVYNFDGPGFNSDVLQHDGYSLIRDRINTFVPQSSVIGMLLEHEEDYHIINSKELGLWQHDLYSWEVSGNDFVYRQTTTSSSKHVDKALKAWVSELEPAQREQFINVIYDMFKSTDARTLRDLSEKWYVHLPVLLRSYKNLDEPVKESVHRTFNALIKLVLPDAPRLNGRE